MTAQQIGPYRLGPPLGQGGMGTVYRAHHTALDTERAVKLMHRVDPRGLARFEREIRTLAEVQHPNVVAIHESGNLDGRPYFVMDLLAGEPLDQVLARERLPWRDGLTLAIGIARGVGALHAAGVVHRDLKPQNVVLAEDRRPVVIDLGLAVAPERDERLTKTGAFVGTISYMAPEQFDAQTAQPQTDVYALGLLAFQLVTGTPAVEDLSGPHQTVASIMAGNLPRPSQRDLDLPLALDRVCARATARDPGARYPNADALADALAQVLTSPGPSARTARRTRLAMLLAGALVVASAIALGLWRAPAPQAAERPTPAETAPPPTPNVTPRPAGPGLSLLQARRGGTVQERITKLRAWLTRNPTHAQRAEATTALRGLLLQEPHLSVTREKRIHAAAWLGPDQFVIASGTTLSRHSIDGGRELEALATRFQPLTLAVTSAGDRLAVAGGRGQLGWIDLRAGLRFAVRRRRLATAVRVLAFSPSGRRLAVAETDPKVFLLPLPALQMEQRFAGHLSPLCALAFAPNGRRLYSGAGVTLTGSLKRRTSEPSRVNCWQLDATGKPLWSREISGRPNCLAVDPTNRLLAIGTSSGQLHLVDAKSGRRRRTLETQVTEHKARLGARLAHDGGLRGVAFSEDGVLLYSCAEPGVQGPQHGGIRTWRVADGAALEVRGLGAGYFGLSLSPGENRLLLVWSREVVEVWALR